MSIGHVLDETRRIADGLVEVHDRGGSYDFSKYDVKQWIVALEDLMSCHQIEVALSVVNAMATRFPQVEYVRKLSLILNKLPPECDDHIFTAFNDDPGEDVQIVQRAKAKAVIFAFAGIAGRLGMPLELMHRWFGAVNVHVVYLRDRNKQAYNDGILSLSDSFEGSVEALRKIAETLGVANVCCYGNSIGGYGALRYGLALPANAALTYGAFTNLTERFCRSSRLAQHGIKGGIDLRPLFEVARRAPKARLVYCQEHPDDAAHAENLRGLSAVWLDPVANASSHDSFLHSIRQDELNEQLRHLIRG